MEKIDRLGWAAGFSFTSYGLGVGVRVSDPAALKLVAERLPPGWRPSAARVVGRLYSLKVGIRIAEKTFVRGPIEKCEDFTRLTVR